MGGKIPGAILSIISVVPGGGITRPPTLRKTSSSSLTIRIRNVPSEASR